MIVSVLIISVDIQFSLDADKMCSLDGGQHSNCQDLPDSWNEDVLVNIFGYLDGEDLLNCEAVCYRWRSIILFGTLWKKLIHRKVHSSSLWRNSWLKMQLDEDNLGPRQYKNIYKAMFQYLKELDEHWNTGTYSCRFYSLKDKTSNDYIALTDRYIGYKCESSGMVKFVDRKTLEIKIPPDNLCSFDENIVVCTDERRQNIKILNRNTAELISEINGQRGWNIEDCRFGNKFLTACSFNENKLYRLTVWRMESPTNVTFLNELTFEEPITILSTTVDDYIICLHTDLDLHSLFWVTFYFVSAKTLEIETSLSFKTKGSAYGGGHLVFEDSKGHVRILDVAAGTYLQDIHLESLEFPEFPMNDKHLAIVNKEASLLAQGLTSVSIYDRQAVLDPNCDPSSALLTSFQIDYIVKRTVMDQTEMIYLVDDPYSGTSKVLVMDFGFHFPNYLSAEALQLHPSNKMTRLLNDAKSLMRSMKSFIDRNVF